jgi:CCR4-NOT transcription complex subunit 6
VHGDREATLQCVLCLRAKVDVRKSFHCSTDCLRRHWGLHKELHGQSNRFNGYTGSENGFQSDKSFKTGHTFSNNGETWIEVAKTRLYTPQAEDVGALLKLDIVSCDTAGGYAREVGRTFSVRSERVRPAPQPPSRELVPLPPPKGRPLAPSGKFTLLTYNLLADLYATNEQFPYCQSWVLGWQYRKQNLLKELLGYSADIVCLQEVQSTHFADFWAPELGKAGYTAIFKKKTAEVYTNNAYAIDGCATFFKRSRFSLVKKYEVEFNKAALSLAENIGPEQKKPALSRLLKDNVALIAVLEALEAPQAEGSGSGSRRPLICIANTHIHANPELNDVKLWQVHTLVKGLEKIAASADIPMLVAGDFNSVPGSAAHSLLVKHSVDADHPELKQDPLGILRPASKLQHKLPLASAYAALAETPASRSDPPAVARQRRRCDPSFSEPKFTNITRDFKGTLDYILYTADSLAPGALLELPEEAEVKPRPSSGLPNDTWSSDHIALMATFHYRQSGGGD